MTSARFPDLADAHVLLTGGGSGIGAALVAGFLDQGARVSVLDLAEATPSGALFLPCDVTDTPALEAAMDTATAQNGPLRALVTLAANDQRIAAVEVTPDIWSAQIDLNLSHYFFACRKAASLMEDGGSIINFSSITYLMGADGMAPYVAANAGIMGLTRSLAREWGPRGIRVNAIAPGWVLTEKQLAKWATPEALSAFLDKQCLKRHMQPQDVVGTALFLASDASAMMTSQTLVLDAGVSVTG